jgi:predicted ATPase
MLTRLKVTGFKNLVDVDVRFGPFTCIAGPNAVGKSNLFDAIRFLSATASGDTLLKAALSVRSENAASSDVRDLFHRVGNGAEERMTFEVEMIAPKEAIDDLGQQAKATATLLRYTLELKLRQEMDGVAIRGPLEIISESLEHIHLKQAGKHLPFEHSVAAWRKSALVVERRAAPYISTEDTEHGRVIKLHQDGGGRGRAVSNPSTSPRTVLSTANAAESPTALCARRELESWQLMQLEPSKLRAPDNLNAPPHLASDGAHLAATLHHLGNSPLLGETRADPERVYCQAVNRLSELIDDVAEIAVDRDEKRQLLTLRVKGRDGASFPARSLSDGTLRFIALTVLEMDTRAHGVVCLEEPENGIHPARIPAIVQLLTDIAGDTNEVVDESNPLRQVIINTHSPGVVLAVPDDSLLVVESRPDAIEGASFRKAVFSHLPGTWRSKSDPGAREVPRGKLLAYLNPCAPAPDVTDYNATALLRALPAHRKSRRVADRSDLQPYLPQFVAE